MVGLASVDTDPEAGWSVGYGRLLSVGQHPFRPGDTRRQLRKQRPLRTSQKGVPESRAARDAAVREAVRGTGLYTASERLWLVGPPQVVAAGNEAFHGVRAIRDAYARGMAVGSTEEASLIGKRRMAMAQMRRLMREGLDE
ncbi:hypothetical protein GCM10022206_58420 [Streptomyces chiangmaiensis]